MLKKTSVAVKTCVVFSIDFSFFRLTFYFSIGFSFFEYVPNAVQIRRKRGTRHGEATMTRDSGLDTTRRDWKHLGTA